MYGYPCLDAQSRLDFDRGESKIAPDTEGESRVMDREAALPHRAWSGPLRAYELQTLAALEGVVSDILHELGANLRGFTRRTAPDADGRKLSPSRFAPYAIRTARYLNETSTARP
jgi:hypothetical protein